MCMCVCMCVTLHHFCWWNMCVCVCVCVCVYICVYIYIYIYIKSAQEFRLFTFFALPDTRVLNPLWRSMYMYISVCVCVYHYTIFLWWCNTYVCVCVCVYIYIYMCVCVCEWIITPFFFADRTCVHIKLILCIVDYLNVNYVKYVSWYMLLINIWSSIELNSIVMENRLIMYMLRWEDMCVCVYIIIIMSCCQHGFPLTLSCHSSLSSIASGRSSRLCPVSTRSGCW